MASEKLISPAWINDAAQGDFLLFEVGSHTRALYRAGHLPRAGYFDTNEVEHPPDWNRLPDAELERMLIAHGISHDRPVVLYGRGSSAAARVAVILLYAGVREVRLLDGGLSAWIAAGYPLETGENPPVPASTFGISIPARLEVFVDTEEVRKMLAEENSVVVSVRSWAEHIGETSGYDYISAKGRIPGSVWGGGGQGKDGMEDFHTPDGLLRPLDVIAARWRDAGITPDKHIAFYCGTGWRASEAYWIAKAMGYPKISVYDGGWLEWSGDPTNPVETGLG